MFSGSDPGNALQLRVNHERVTVGAGKDSTVFDGNLIVRKLLGVPLGLLGIVGQDEERVVLGGGWQLVFLEVLHEVVIENNLTELLGEGSNVRDEGGGKKHITSHVVEILS